MLRRLGAQVPRAAARRFHQVAWPGSAVLVATGIWNIADGQDKITGSYRRRWSPKSPRYLCRVSRPS